MEWWREQLEGQGLEELIRGQAQIVARSQLLAAGWSRDQVRGPLRSGRWRRVHPGVYATHTGPIGYDERLLAGLLYAGPEAAWSHYTAAEQLKLVRLDASRPVYLVIPERRQVVPRPGIVVRRDRHWAERLATVAPPRRTAAHAVLDIVGDSPSLDEAAAAVAAACQSGRVGPDALLSALADRQRLRHRSALRGILGDVAAGVHSLLELRYLRDVERRHRLPVGVRQRAVEREFTDVFYTGFGLAVELDGRLHLTPAHRRRDLTRDNRATLRTESTLRYGWADITGQPCAVAAQVLQVLRRTTPTLAARRCSATCLVEEEALRDFGVV